MPFLGLDLGSWVLVLLGLWLVAYLYLRRNYGVWEAKGLFSLPPTVIFGNNFPVLTGRVHINDFHKEFYKKMEGHK